MRGNLFGKILIALGLGVISALLLPSWLMVMVLGVLVVGIGICICKAR